MADWLRSPFGIMYPQVGMPSWFQLADAGKVLLVSPLYTNHGDA